MINKSIGFHEPFITGEEADCVLDAIKNNRLSSIGKYTDYCQHEISLNSSLEHVLLTDSCTSALEMIALALRDTRKRQKVILPSYTFSSTATAFAKIGFDLSFADINPKLMTLDVSSAEKLIDDDTVAIILVHYGGFIPSNAAAIASLCNDNGLMLIEDAAQTYGSYNTASLDYSSDFVCFSFHQTKNLHAGYAGALGVNNPDYVDKIHYIRERGTNRKDVLSGAVKKYEWVCLGGSYLPSELQSAFLTPQLRALKKCISIRKRVFDIYKKDFDDFQHDNHNISSYNVGNTNYHAFWIMASNKEEYSLLMAQAKLCGVELYRGYVPLHSSPMGKTLTSDKIKLPETEKYAELLLRLPIHTAMDCEDAAFVSGLVCDVLRKKYDC